MRLKLTLVRPSGSSSDIVVTADAAATISEIAATISRVDAGATHKPERNLTLRATLPGQGDPLTLPPDAPVGEAWIGSGASVSLHDAGVMYRAPSELKAATVGTLRVLAGPDAGREVALKAGSLIVGRDAACDIVLSDNLVSKKHVRLEVSDTVEVIDLGSANGIVVDGGIVGRLQIEKASRLLLGDDDIEISLMAGAAPEAAPKPGPIFFNRSPKVETRYTGTEFTAPDVPEEPDEAPFPLLAMMTPVFLGLAMAFIMQRPSALLFCLMSPVMMIGNFITQKTAGKRKLKKAVAKFEQKLDALSTLLAAERTRERSQRLLESPSTEEAYAHAIRRGPLLWTRRPEHWSFLNVRLGIGTMSSRNEIIEGSRGDMLPDFQERLDAVVEANRLVDGVPLIDNFFDSGALGIAGSPDSAAGSINSVLVQLTALHSPAELVVAALLTPRWSNEFEWLKWMPHTSSAHSPLAGSHLADSPSSGAVLLSAIEGLIAARLGSQSQVRRRGAMEQEKAALERGADIAASQEADGTQSEIPAVILLISDDVALDRARLVQIAELGADAGVYPIWIAGDVAELPAVCRTYLSVPSDGSQAVAGFVRLGETITDVETELVSKDRALAYAKRMAPVIDAGALVADASDLPRTVSLVTLLGHDMVETSDAVIDRWQQNASIHDRSGGKPKPHRAGKLRAIIGSAGVDAMHLDLRTQGPHALVGGTTGAGKSEFLQAWVLGMAAEYSPDRVTFLFVDYKGGSAFADCVTLPHCVGLVTDLSPHLVRRALTSLRAELHHREHLLNRKKAKDLLELEKRGDPDSPPALVLVIDEFAALATEVPEFVDGVVDIAQRGRSLGIHLIMATQRPAGVIKDNLRANTPLRIALRMADESDSSDVIGTADAAHFDPAIPGRGVAKTGPGRLAQFQSAYAGGWTSREPERAGIDVAELRFGAESKWEEPGTGAPVDEERDLGPTDQQRLVTTIVAAAGRAAIPAPRRPWQDELAPLYDLGKLRQRTDSALLLGVSDLPHRQEQNAVYFQPDVDGHVAIFGTGGSGKSALLRTLAAAAGITPRGGPVHVYGLDFGTGSLRMLEALPHVGSIISGDDSERVVRLFRSLKATLEERGPRYAEANASNIADYRELSGKRDEPRILLLIDGYPAFRDDWESTSGRMQWYNVFKDILTDGRQLGMHIALTADRSGAVPTGVSSSIQRRIVLRLADEGGYGMLDVPGDILSAKSPAGRAIVDGMETQIAILGGTSAVAAQSAATQLLADSMRRAGIADAPPIGSMPTEYSASELPDTLGGSPVLGVSDLDLGPYAFDPTGVMIVAGPPASGRTTALHALAQSIRRAQPDARLYYLGNPRSPLARGDWWAGSAVAIDEVAALAKDLAAAVADPDTEGRIVVMVETISDFLQTPAEAALTELVKAVKRSDHSFIAESETSTWGSSWGLFSEIKNVRRGLLLQPDYTEGEFLLKTPLPRSNRAEFPPGRGVFISRGKFVRVQLPLPVAEPAGERHQNQELQLSASAVG
jgi:S-DNA-T family DNA segregation ATPase FtsK/SpoIIIE